MQTFSSVNPRTSAPIGSYPIANANDVACAVECARKSSHEWAARDVAERARSLRQLRDSVGEHADALAGVVSHEIGKPLQEAYAADVLSLVGALDWLSRHLPALLSPRNVPGERRANLLSMPYGVVGVIGTWNYPLLLDGTSVAWALAAGNAVVWKPSELAAASSLALCAHFERAGLPVVLVTGDGTTGRALCDTLIDKLAFTGGVATGRTILAQLAVRGIPSVMELSGNDALVVCADADICSAARAAVWGRVCNAGQSCVSPQRMYVAAEAYPAFLTECERIVKTLRPGVDYGPLRTDGLRQRTHGLVTNAVRQGARLMAGGHCLHEEEFARGFHYAPTLLADCRDDMAVMQEDFFGPVLCVRSVRDAEEAIELANSSDMGLGASVWTQDVNRAKAIAGRLRAGVVTINSETLLTGARPGLPFGGVGASGWGRQRGAAGLDEFVQWKAVCWQRSAGAQRHVFPYREATMPILRGMLAVKTAQGAKAKMQAIRRLTNAARNWKRAR